VWGLPPPSVFFFLDFSYISPPFCFWLIPPPLIPPNFCLFPLPQTTRPRAGCFEVSRSFLLCPMRLPSWKSPSFSPFPLQEAKEMTGLTCIELVWVKEFLPPRTDHMFLPFPYSRCGSVPFSAGTQKRASYSLSIRVCFFYALLLTSLRKAAPDSL